MDDHQTHCPDNNHTNQNHGASHSHQNKEQDRFLPIANVGRIMKKMIPGNGKISKDAKESAQECVSEFISFVTGEASDKCQREKRKTINGDDVIWSITTLGFEDYVAPLKKYLNKYRQIEEEKLNNVPKQQHRIGADQDHSLGGFTSSSPTHFVIQHHHQGHFEGGAGMEQGYMCTLQQQQDQLEYGGRQWGRDL